MSLSLLRSRRLLTVLCAAGLLACVVAGASAQTTTFTGTVYSPLGPPGNGNATPGDPIPNILVFVEDPNNPAPTFGKGIVVPNGGCSAQPSLVPISVLGSAVTKPDGTFSFNVAGVLPATVRLFIQAGKWRSVQSIPLSNINVGGPNSYTLSMPSTAVAGVSDLPNIAVVTGSADDVECIFPQIGISNSEVTDPGGAGHINFFLGGGTAGGEVISANSPTEAQLLNPSATGAIPLTNYDLVVFGCDGNPASDTANSSAYGANLVPYTTDGGRIFLTHYEWPWLQSSFPSIATWLSTSKISDATAVGQLDPAYSGEPILYSWMNAIGALDVNTSASTPQFNLTNVRTDINAMNSPAQSWVRLPNISGDPIVQFSFDTPVGAGGTPIVSLNFSNSTSNGTSAFLTGDADDVVTVAVSNTSSTPTTAGLTLSLTIPTVLQVLSVVDSSGGTWVCTFTSPTATCTLPGPLVAGASDSVAISFKIPLGTALGIYTLTGALSKGGLNQSAQCGRVLYNDYHVEASAMTKQLWSAGSHCSTGKLDAAQKFLEYSLYNLSSFVAPANSDTIQIQASSTITWTPITPTYYGTKIAQIETATVNTPGILTYSITPGNGQDLLDANAYTFKASFVPNDIVDYLKSSLQESVVIQADPTTATITNLVSPIFYAQEIGFENGVNAGIDIATQQGLPNLTTTPTLSGGVYTLTIDGAVVCSGSGGIAALGGASPGACPDAKLLGYIAGSHALSLTYSGATDFAPPVAYNTTVLINSDPTTTNLTTSGTGNSVFGTGITFTASVTDTYTAPVGTVTFYDSPTPVSGISTPTAAMTAIFSAPVANYSAAFFTNLLAPGTHNIAACFAAPLDSLGVPNMAPSCSSSVMQIVASLPADISSTQTLLTSNVNPSYFGQAVTFTSPVSTTGAFVEIPKGTVTYYADGTMLGAGTLDGKGVGSFTTSVLAVGTHNMTAAYAGTTAGTPQFAASTSATYVQVVMAPLQSAGTGFILQVVPTSITMPVGGNVSVSVTVIELNNFQTPVQLSCVGLPSEGTCNFVQSLIPATGGSTQLTIGATSPHDCSTGIPYIAGGRGAGLAWLGITALGMFLARKRRRLLQSLAVAAALLLLPALQGCGTGNCTDFGLKPGTYTFTITGNSTGTPVLTRTQAMTMTVTVQ